MYRSGTQRRRKLYLTATAWELSAGVGTGTGRESRPILNPGIVIPGSKFYFQSRDFTEINRDPGKIPELGRDPGISPGSR